MLSRFSLVVERDFTDFLTQGVDVVLQGDVLEEGVLQHCLQLLINLKTQFQSHPRVRNFAVIQARHDSLAGSNFSLQKYFETERLKFNFH